MPNLLRREKSPYLLQHADNPVDWRPWGAEAFEAARRDDKPVFVSIGYATCHWCHVMAHESFEDDEVAAVLNQGFVSIKVDREERPDVDQVYMKVCQAMTGRGGWPLSVWLDPAGRAFFAGTYFPKNARMGMNGFIDILKRIDQLWREDRGKLFEIAARMTERLQADKPTRAGRLGETELRQGFTQLRRAFDPVWGGFGGAPKFPTPHHLTFLLRWHARQPDSEARDMVEKTLRQMRWGGIYDHLGFGFARYSVDQQWLVPHFEKMLYDQALLLMAYAEACQVFGNPEYRRTAREITTYVLRDMTSPQGAFYSAEDADSEGVEGKFYVWTPAEVEAVLGAEDADLFGRFYDVTETGNFEGQNILHQTRDFGAFARAEGLDPDEAARRLADAREKLFAARLRRVPPLKDDKVLTAWNGLMIAALAQAGALLGEADLIRAADRAADFILQNREPGTGRLFRRFRHDEKTWPAYADDYAFFIWGLIELYEAGFDPKYLAAARDLQRLMDEHYLDPEGGYFFTPHDGQELIVRDKEFFDGATPASNSVAALNLVRLARLTGETAWEETAEQIVSLYAFVMGPQAMAHTQFLNALDFALGPTREAVVVAGDDQAETEAVLDLMKSQFRPRRVTLFKPAGEAGELLGEIAPWTAEHVARGGRVTLYVCENFTCREPVVGLEAIEAALAPDAPEA
jgi:uncharacterized protein YyaL (SSP411 family)